MISSVPYVPPDTIKNVATMSGQSVSFSAFFFWLGVVREEKCAGTCEEFNFYSRPPRAILTLDCRWSELAFAEYRSHPGLQEKNASKQKFFAAYLHHHSPRLCYTPPFALTSIPIPGVTE